MREETGVRPSCRSAAPQAPGRTSPGGSRQAGALRTRMAWVGRDRAPRHLPPTGRSCSREAFPGCPGPGLQRRPTSDAAPSPSLVLQGPSSPGPSWERSRLRASSSRRRTLMVAQVAGAPGREAQGRPGSKPRGPEAAGSPPLWAGVIAQPHTPT